MIKAEKHLPESRILEIQAEMSKDLIRWGEVCKEIWVNNHNASPKNDIDCSRPSWATYATTNPPSENSLGVRGCIAFHKSPCMFKKQTGGRGCTHCGLSLEDKNLDSVLPTDQITAVKTAIAEITEQLGYTPPVIEILPNGSFLNTDEVSEDAQNGIFKVISNNEEVLQVAIETRTENISITKIKHLLKLLRNDQILEIYVGLESIDNFVSGEIINKGFTVNQYEARIQEFATNCSDEEKKRLHLSVYHFFKPPYLTEKESIEASIAMAEKVKEYEQQTGIKFSVKYEPAIISDGTLQSYLFNQNKFTPPNYFSLAEVIANSYFNNFLDIIKFGQRDDIDDFQAVASIPNLKDKHMFSPFDYMVYNAVQRFNADQDIWGFCADMRITIENSPEFKKWEEEIYGNAGESCLAKLFAEYQKQNFSDKYNERIDFQKRVWRSLDAISYDNGELSSKIQERGQEGAADVEARIIAIFLKEGIKVLQIKNIKFFDVGQIDDSPKLINPHNDFANATQKAVYQYEIIIENEAGLPQSVWEKVSLEPVEVELENFHFIYQK